MDASPKQSTELQLRAALYARLSETYDAAESVPTQLANADRHAARRGWWVVARFKDDGYSAFKEIRRDDFVNLIQMIERDEIDVVIVRDVDRLTRNLPGGPGSRRRDRAPGDPERLRGRGPGPVHPGRRVLRRDGDAAGEAGKRGPQRPRPRGARADRPGGEVVRGRPAVVRVHPRVRQPRRDRQAQAGHPPRRGQPDGGRRAAGRRRADPARRDGRVDHPRVDPARDQAVRRREMGRDVPGQHAQVAPAGGPAGMGTRRPGGLSWCSAARRAGCGAARMRGRRARSTKSIARRASPYSSASQACGGSGSGSGCQACAVPLPPARSAGG